jgi:hypothetical protein
VSQTNLPDQATLALARQLAELFAPLPQVAAVALAGSQLSGTWDAGSDLDLYIYTRAEVPLEFRAALAERRAAPGAEVGNDDWGPGDEWEDAETGRAVDLVYFDCAWLEAHLSRLLVGHQPSLGYTTAIWSTLQRSLPLYDRDGWFASIQARTAQPYPEPLRRAIIRKNHPLLRTRRAAYLRQLEKAVARRDRISLNHRLAGLLASYFDTLFALNRVPHPGEKRQLAYARSMCALLPSAMEEEVEGLLSAQAAAWGDDRLLREAERLIDGLDALLRDEGLLER